jgi:carboxyl-terminal processing protease
MAEPTTDVSKKKKAKQPRIVQLRSAVFVGVLLAVVMFVLGSRAQPYIAQLTASQNKNLPAQLDLSSVNEVYAQLRNKFDGSLDANKLIDGAKKGLVEAAGDTYTVYFTANEAKEFNNELNGNFSGIGAELAKQDDKAKVVSVLDNSPAQKAGLQTGDIFLTVNGQDISGMALDKVVSSVRGDKGTTVKITFLRGTESKEVAVTRDDITDPSVKTSILDNNIGYLRISRFATDTAELAKKAAEDFKTKNVKGVILDLRGNGGGYVDAAQSVATLWLNNKEVVQERQGDKVLSTLTSGSDTVLEGIPTIVLVDGGSASASEIVAGALHDHKAATLVGEKTFGKGSVQETVSTINGLLKVTIAKWYTPNGKNINKEGIMPDEVVTLSDDDIKQSNDTQKQRALDELNK